MYQLKALLNTNLYYDECAINFEPIANQYKKSKLSKFMFLVSLSKLIINEEELFLCAYHSFSILIWAG